MYDLKTLYWKEVDDICLTSDSGSWANITGLCTRVAWVENNFIFEICSISNVTFDLDIQKNEYE